MISTPKLDVSFSLEVSPTRGVAVSVGTKIQYLIKARILDIRLYVRNQPILFRVVHSENADVRTDADAISK
jgi:hypothetical protein